VTTSAPLAPRTIGVISDTHGLLRPEAVAALRGVDLIVHAGDVGSDEVLRGLEAVAPVRAVRGNTDRAPSMASLPATAVVEIEGTLLYVLHDLAALEVDPRAAGLAAIIAGHSHRPSLSRRDGVLYLNPGSAGPRRFGLPVTVARLRVTPHEIQGELVTLEP
jgi:putative phosphoesterase